MPIHFSCPSCNKPLAVADDKAGVKVACPDCKHTLRVPNNGHAAGDGPGTRPKAAASSSTSGAEAAVRVGGPHALSGWNQVDGILGEAVEVIDRPLNAHEEGQVRAALTAYANSVPHHGLPPLGRKVTITGVREHRVHRVHLESLFEKRHAARKSEPFQGNAPPAPTVTDANVEVWSYPYPTGKEFRSGSVEHRIEESRHVVVCKSCSGHGQVACTTCSGSGAVACSGCGGSGAVKCRQCGGHGMVQRVARTEQRQRHCIMCKGGVRKTWNATSPSQDTYETCSTCNGTAVIFEEVPVHENVECPSCHRGGVRCPTCGGHGQVRCPKCSGSGKLSCSTCKATGKMLSYLAVVQTFEPNTQTISVPCSGLKDAAIAGMVQPSDYSPLLALATTGHPADLKLTSGIEKLRAAITKAFDAALARVSDENRLTRQRLQVGVASVLEVGYEFEGEPYTAWFVGKQFRIYAPTSPVTDALREMVKEAVRTWKKGDQKDATLQLRHVMDMAKADPPCQRAYDEVQHTIPSDLESKARWVRWKPFILAAAVIFGIVFLIGLIGVGYAIFKAKGGGSRPAAPPPFMGGPQRPGENGPGGPGGPPRLPQ